MRIAVMIETDYRAGAEVMTFDLACALRERGHEVHYVGPAHGAGWGREAYEAAGFPCHLYEHRPPFDQRCARWLVGLVRRHGIEVLHAHEFLLIVYGAVASLAAGVPLVATLHGNPAMTAVLRRRIALRLAFRRASSVVAVSSATAAHLTERLGVIPNLVEIPNGVRVVPGDRRRIRNQLRLAEDDLLVLGVGTLTERKGFIHLLRALGRLPTDLRWSCAIAGAHDDAAPQLAAFIEERGWRDRVHLLGVRPDVGDLQAAADIFVMPSLWEGLPLALLEAMFAGKPIIASRTQGIPEAIEPDRTGLLCEPGDDAALADGLRQLLESRELRDRLGAAARALAEERYAHARMVNRYEELYRRAVVNG